MSWWGQSGHWGSYSETVLSPASFLFIHGAANGVFSETCHPWIAQLRSGQSPICEFVFCVACARSTKNAAGAENPVPPCSDRTGHSRTPQQGPAVEFTECGQSGCCGVRRLKGGGYGTWVGTQQPTLPAIIEQGYP